MSMFENPSADKFGPPPENARREQEHERAGKPSTRGRGKDFLLAALALVGLGLQFAPWTRGWIGASLIVLGLIVLVVEHLVQIRIRDERGGPEPYSPWNRITR